MSAAVIMMAKTGRLTLTSAMFMDALPDRPPAPRPSFTLTPVASWLRLVVASCLVALQPARHLHELVLARAQRDLLLAGLAVLDDVDRRHTGERRDRFFGHGEHARIDCA